MKFSWTYELLCLGRGLQESTSGLKNFFQIEHTFTSSFDGMLRGCFALYTGTIGFLNNLRQNFNTKSFIICFEKLSI